uniref:Uncharacterized protein n=1 Tax=Nelumbo nucifera TaxID=4432 RepID=A0A822ZBM9_NELNU|nr:TPA_asm: hypothetical protein HUJ06_000762 [Nelumbo nucifera]
MSSAISQISCFSSISRKLQLRKLSIPPVILRSKLSVSMHLDGSGTERQSSETKTTLRYTADTSRSPLEGTTKSYSNPEEQVGGNLGMGEPLNETDVIQKKRCAKIHDFCFGIPFGKYASASVTSTEFALYANRMYSFNHRIRFKAH